jgi:thiopeptide-type bacteriocin biosynthesis protein
MADRDWISAHVFYSDGLDRPLTETVRPLVSELIEDRLVRAYFYLRYWDGGPHLRLRLLPARARTHDQVREIVATHCETYLRRYPSTTPVDATEYAASARRLARRERLPSYAETPYPNNSVQFIAYRPEHDRYGTGDCLNAVEEHFADSSQIALALVSAGATPAARETAGFCAAMLAMLLRPHGARVGAAPAAHYLHDLAERYASQRDRLLNLGEAMRRLASGTDAAASGTDAAASGTDAAASGRVPASGALAAWRDSIATLYDALAPHRELVNVDAVVDTCVHLFCNRLGVSLTEEDYIRYLAARTAADLPEGE